MAANKKSTRETGVKVRALPSGTEATAGDAARANMINAALRTTKPERKEEFAKRATAANEASKLTIARPG